jgi:hypothetical protein
VAPRAGRPDGDVGEPADRYRFLAELHRQLQPRTYLEIGVRNGRGLSLSGTRTLGVDPRFEITFELNCDLQLVRATSDELFAREHPLAHFGDLPVDLAFIDGMHLFEFALRDFMNVERHSEWTSVTVFDDVLPRNVREPSRERKGMVAWTGDVFKLLGVLREYRPDVMLLPVDVEPAGLLLVLGADPDDAVLASCYEEIVSAQVRPDPQRVPEDVLRREGALDPASLLESGLLALLRESREAGVPRDRGWPAVDDTAAGVQVAALRDLRPEQLRPRGSGRGQRPIGRLARARRRLRGVPRRLRRSASS